MEWFKENNFNSVLITKPAEKSFYNKVGFDRSSNGFISMLKWD